MSGGKLTQGGIAPRQIRVLAVLVLGLLLLAYGIYQVGRLFDVFASRYQIVALVEGSAGTVLS